MPAAGLVVRSQHGSTVATITGELGAASVSALREQLRGLADRQARRIIIDLSGVTSCDASGLAVLVAAGRRAWLLGGILQRTAPAPAALTALRLTGLDTHFEIVTPVKTIMPNVPDASAQATLGAQSTVR